MDKDGVWLPLDLLLSGTVSLSSFDGHCVRIDFSNREQAEQMFELLGSPAPPRKDIAE